MWPKYLWLVLMSVLNHPGRGAFLAQESSNALPLISQRSFISYPRGFFTSKSSAGNLELTVDTVLVYENRRNNIRADFKPGNTLRQRPVGPPLGPITPTTAE